MKYAQLDSEVFTSIVDVGWHHLNAFLNWAAKNRFVASDLQVKKVKVAQKPVTALTPAGVRAIPSGTARPIPSTVCPDRPAPRFHRGTG